MLHVKRQFVVPTDRHADFIRLEYVIRETHDLFLEMAALVAQQEELVSNIWENLGAAVGDFRSGNANLKKAEWYKTSARKNKIILAVILSVLLLVIVLIIVWEFSN